MQGLGPLPRNEILAELAIAITSIQKTTINRKKETMSGK